MLDGYYFKSNYQLIDVDLSKILGTDPMAIQQIDFNGDLETKSQICTILDQYKDTVLEFYKGAPKVL